MNETACECHLGFIKNRVRYKSSREFQKQKITNQKRVHCPPNIERKYNEKKEEKVSI